MFIVTGKAALIKAIDRAKALHPHVRIVAFGEYQVTGSKGREYTVRCYRDEYNQKIVECGCATRDGIACKHGVAALPLHIHMAAQRMNRTAH